MTTTTQADAADWLGNVSADWFASGNWNPAAVPGSGTAVTINNGSAPNPANVTAAGAQAASVDIGTAAGQSGTLNVTGGALAIAGSLQAGNSGSGTVNISAGGTIGTVNAYLAVNPNSAGTVTISGAGSKLTATSTYIGMDAGAVGQMTVQNGATLASTNTVIGYFSPTASGTLNVSGATFTNSGTLTIGERGTGVLNLSNGSTATTNSVRLGVDPGTGTLTVSSGSQLTSSRNGATGNVVTIGGTATVTGTGSQWLIDSGQPVAPIAGTALAIGKAAATSSLTVSNGGAVTLSSTATGTNAANFDTRIGVGAGTTANLTVTGANSAFTTAYRFYVGFAANSTGNVTVSNGGALNTGYTEIGAGPSAGVIGTANVTGAGSAWTIADSPNLPGGHAQGLWLGLSGGDGTLTIADGGTVNVNATGRLVRLGGTAGSTATLNIGAAAAGPAAGAGTLNADAVVFVTNGGTSTINFNHTSNNYTFATAISGTGPGAVNFLAGTTILTGNNTFTGTTSISAGATAQLGNGGNAGGSNGLVPGNISNNGSLIFNVGGFQSYGGVISGNGMVEQRGPANTTFTLTGNNTYSGLTTVTSGTLQVGNGGTTGSIAGNVLNNSQITFNRSDNFSFNNVISGTGSLTKSGAGVMTLGNTNTYTGGTSVQQGILRLGGNNQLASTGSLFVFAARTFDLAGFNQTVGDLSGPGIVAIGAGTFTAGTANNRTFAGQFTGSGTFIKQGSGSLTLTGNSSTYTGTTTVTNGTLFANGNLSGSAVTVNGGATLGGAGTVGATTVHGNVAPGNSIGTLNVVGPFTQATGSTYTTEVNTTTSDLINVAGAATIQGGAGVNVLAAPGLYTVGHRYTILTATGGVAGTYTTLTDNAPFVDFALAYDPNNVYLDVLRSSIMFQQLAQTPNQRASANGIQSLSFGNPVFDAVVMLDAANAPRAFDLLSGEIHASVKSTLAEESRFVRDAIMDRVRQAFGGVASFFAPRLAAINYADDDGTLPYAKKKKAAAAAKAIDTAVAPTEQPETFTAWGQAFGNWGKMRGDGNAAGLDRDTGGFLTGIDRGFGTSGQPWRFGVATGYQHSSAHVGDRSSSASIDSYHLAGYGATQYNALALRFGVAQTWHEIDTTRTIAIPGFSDVAKAKYDATTTQIFGEAGYGFTVGQIAAEPFAALAHVRVKTDGFTESAGAAALTSYSSSDNTTFSTLGIRAATPIPVIGEWAIAARGTLGWRHAFGDPVPVRTLAFASGGNPFDIAGTPVAKNALVFEAGLDAALNRNTTIGILYSGQYGSAVQDHAIKGEALRRF